MNTPDQLEILQRGCDEILPKGAFEERLEAGPSLRIKAGFDPTAADLHLGHMVLLNKLRQFQDAGHEVMFLVGDFTAMIGDPTGKNVTRQPLTPEQVQANAKTYTDQVFKILDRERTTVLFNSQWLGKFTGSDMIKLAAKQTVARMLERDDFSKRYASGQGIAIHEFLYPLLQGYDSVAMKADVELGGTDQKFNLLMGRELQKSEEMAQQVVMTLPLLVGLDGVKKMSKSLDNFIAIDDAPNEMFGKIMSVSDELMWSYFELVSRFSNAQIDEFKSAVASGTNPRDIKFELGLDLVSRLHGKEAAQTAKEAFINRFAKGQLPDEIPEVHVVAEGGPLPIGVALKLAGLVESSSEAMRLIKQGAVKIDGEKLCTRVLKLEPGTSILAQVGKRRIAQIICS